MQESFANMKRLPEQEFQLREYYRNLTERDKRFLAALKIRWWMTDEEARCQVQK